MKLYMFRVPLVDSAIRRVLHGVLSGTISQQGGQLPPEELGVAQPIRIAGATKQLGPAILIAPTICQLHKHVPPQPITPEALSVVREAHAYLPLVVLLFTHLVSGGFWMREVSFSATSGHLSYLPDFHWLPL